MNKLEMQTMESRRLLRMTTTERANHERIKREILDARGPGAGNPSGLGIKFVAPVHDEIELSAEMKENWRQVLGLQNCKVEATADPENPRRLDLKVTVQLAGNILETNEEVAVGFPDEPDGFGETEIPSLAQPRLANLPDAQLTVGAWAHYVRGDIIRRSVLGDVEFDEMVRLGWIAPVKRPRDGTARDYVSAILALNFDGCPCPYGETVPDSMPPSVLVDYLERGWITVAK